MKKLFWIGKTNADVLGHKRPMGYLLGTLSESEERCDCVTQFLAGFAGYEIVKIEIKEVKRIKKLSGGK